MIYDINLDVEKGKFVVFVGMSGGGKFMFISLILCFYDVIEGKIFIDDIDIKIYKVCSLWDKIGIVL